MAGSVASTVTRAPIATDSAKARAKPSAVRLRAEAASSASPIVVARARATLGPSSGAITIAAMITARSSRSRPTAATITASTVITA